MGNQYLLLHGLVRFLMYKGLPVVLLSGYLLTSHPSMRPSIAENINNTELSFINPEVKTNTNIHFSKYYCSECHIQYASNKPVTMRFNNYTQTCRCHNYTPENYTHPIGIPLSSEKRKKIPPNFPLTHNTITCATCHLMTLQCAADSSIQKINKSFLRIKPLPSRTAICYKCHDEAKYRMLDPHRQLDKTGKIIKEKCFYCHNSIPELDRRKATNKDQYFDLINPIGELNALCYRCHYKQVKLHPINADHLKKPSPRIAKVMKRSEQQLGIILPLDRKGNVTCITCHNPHERGVIDGEAPGAGGAGESYRLRVTKIGDRICLACHQIK